jgi:hypothetical protein
MNTAEQIHTLQTETERVVLERFPQCAVIWSSEGAEENVRHALVLNAPAENICDIERLVRSFRPQAKALGIVIVSFVKDVDVTREYYEMELIQARLDRLVSRSESTELAMPSTTVSGGRWVSIEPANGRPNETTEALKAYFNAIRGQSTAHSLSNRWASLQNTQLPELDWRGMPTDTITLGYQEIRLKRDGAGFGCQRIMISVSDAAKAANEDLALAA